MKKPSGLKLTLLVLQTLILFVLTIVVILPLKAVTVTIEWLLLAITWPLNDSAIHLKEALIEHGVLDKDGQPLQ